MKLFAPLGMVFMVWYVLFIKIVPSYAMKGMSTSCVESSSSRLAEYEKLDVPVSTSTLVPDISVVVVVTKDSIYVDHILVSSLDKLSDSDVASIPELLNSITERAHPAVGEDNDDVLAARQVVVIADRETPYRVLMSVIHTMNVGGYRDIKLGVYHL